MQERLCEVFEGVISGMTRWGMYVELSNTVEGLVHVANMKDDHYEYNEQSYEMTGLHLKKVYRLGQKVYVRVISVDRLLRTIDFEIVDEGDLEDGEDRWQDDSQ